MVWKQESELEVAEIKMLWRVGSNPDGRDQAGVRQGPSSRRFN